MPITPKNLNTALKRRRVSVYHPGSGAADATETWPLAYFDNKVKILNVYVITQTAITGAATNYMNLNIIDKGTGGSGTNELGNLDFASGTNTTAFDAKTFGTLSNNELAAGSVLSVQREKVGTGLALPECAFVVEYKEEDDTEDVIID